jgi:hypothetical protein
MVRGLIIAKDQNGTDVYDRPSGYRFGGKDTAAWIGGPCHVRTEYEDRDTSRGANLWLCWRLGRVPRSLAEECLGREAPAHAAFGLCNASYHQFPRAFSD